jgi:predicted dehydrogenase
MSTVKSFAVTSASNSQQLVMNAGVIGAGFIGEVHVRAIRASGGVVHSIAAASLEESVKAANSLGIANAVTAEAMLRDPDIDVIHICTPNIFHAELAEKAIKSGKSVICEKPLAISVEDAENLVNLAAENGVVASVPFVYRYHPSAIEARERIKNLKEKLNLLHGYYLQDWLSREQTVNWRIDPSIGGPSRAFGDIGIHWCDMMEFVTGHRIIQISSQFLHVFNSRSGGGKIGTEDGATIMFKTDQGALGSLVLSQVSAGYKNKLWFSFESATESFVFNQESPDSLWIGGLESNQIVMRGVAESSQASRNYSFLPAGHPQGYQDCFNNFVSDSYRAIGGVDSHILPTFKDGLRAAKLTRAVLESSSTGKWVDVL